MILTTWARGSATSKARRVDLAENPVFFLSFGPVLRRLQGLTAGEDHGTLPLASCLLGKAMSAEDARQPLPWSLGAFNH